MGRLSLQLVALCSIALCVAIGARSAPARACSLDGLASISVDGAIASLTGGAPNSRERAVWAPFTLIAVAPGDSLRFAEDLALVRRSVPDALLHVPFRWDFGDRTVTSGWAVSHRYTSLGWRRVAVHYYWPARRRWVLFDSARIQVVARGDLWRANLGYNIGRIALVAMRLALWATIAALLGLAIWIRWMPARWKATASRALGEVRRGGGSNRR